MLENQKGFGIVQVLLFIVLVGLITGTGFYIYKAQQNTNKSLDSANKTLDDLAEDKQTKPENKVKEEDSWFLYEPSDKAFSVRIPDGWTGVALYDNLYVRNPANMVYTQGTKAQIEVLEDGGWDGASPFSLYYPKQNGDQIVREGAEQDALKTGAGLSVRKFIYTQETEPDGIGYQKGSKVYSYYFDSDGKYLQVSHVVAPGETDRHEIVERLVRTIVIK